MYSGQVKEQMVYLNGVVGGHLFEDTQVVVVYDIDPPEPDIMQPEIVFLYLESVAGNALPTISNSLSPEQIDSLIDQIEDN